MKEGMGVEGRGGGRKGEREGFGGKDERGIRWREGKRNMKGMDRGEKDASEERKEKETKEKGE